MTTDALIHLQKRADEFALTLEGDERMLVWKLRSAVGELAELKAKLRTMGG